MMMCSTFTQGNGAWNHGLICKAKLIFNTIMMVLFIDLLQCIQYWNHWSVEIVSVFFQLEPEFRPIMSEIVQSLIRCAWQRDPPKRSLALQHGPYGVIQFLLRIFFFYFFFYEGVNYFFPYFVDLTEDYWACPYLITSKNSILIQLLVGLLLFFTTSFLLWAFSVILPIRFIQLQMNMSSFLTAK